MGSVLGKQTVPLSPNHAMNFLKPTMIETSGSVKLDISNYSRSQIIRQLDQYNDKLGDHKSTIVSVLNHDDFVQNVPENQREIYFINSRCESILQIVNSSNGSMDRVMAINVDVLEKQQ
jgi:hypothetical protein